MASAEQSARALAERAVALVNSSHNVIFTGDLYLGAETPPEDVLLLVRALEAHRPRCERREAPRGRPPVPYPDRIDRDEQVATLVGALGERAAVNLHGDDGVGKTYVLRAAAERMRAPDGVVWVEAAGRAAGDVLQAVFEELFDAHPTIATPELRRSVFAGVRAVVVVDGASEDGADQIRTELADSSVVLATRRGVPWGGPAAEVQVAGLGDDDAVALLARRVPGGSPAAQRLVALLRGNPRRIVQAAALAERRGIGLDVLVSALAAGPEDELRRLLVEALDPDERELVDVLAGAFGATLAIERLQSLTGVRDVPSRLQTLERDGIVQSGSPRYRLAVAHDPAAAGRVAKELAEFAAVEDLPAAMAVLRAAGDELVVELGPAIAPRALYGRQWEAWSEILERVQRAAARTRNAAAAGWALHHIGTRDYARGDAGSAEAALRDALGIRRGLGDERGAAATQHNLDFIASPLDWPDGDGGEPPPEPPPGPRWPWIAAAATALAVAVAVGVAVAGGGDGEQESATPTPSPTVTEEATPEERTPTPTPTPTPEPITVAITAPEASTYAPEELPPAAFMCTGEDVECSATVGAIAARGQPAAVEDGGQLPTAPGTYTLTATATAPDREPVQASRTYTVAEPPADEDVIP